MPRGDTPMTQLSRRQVLWLMAGASTTMGLAGCDQSTRRGTSPTPGSSTTKPHTTDSLGGRFAPTPTASAGPTPPKVLPGNLEATTTAQPAADVTVTDLLKVWPFHVAHRGGSANWPEMTLAAYDNSYRHGLRALEVSLHRSADGVFVCSHDDNLQRVTGKSVQIAKNSWATLRSLDVRRTDYTSAPAPSDSNQKTTLCRLEDVLDRYADRCVLFIEDKTQQHTGALVRLLQKRSQVEKRIVWKVHGSVQENALAAGRDIGLTTWGYFFAHEMDTFERMAPRFSWLGLDYNCSPEQLKAATSRGQTTIGHIVHTEAQYNKLLDAGCNGIMLGNVARMARRPGL